MNVSRIDSFSHFHRVSSLADSQSGIAQSNTAWEATNHGVRVTVEGFREGKDGVASFECTKDVISGNICAVAKNIAVALATPVYFVAHIVSVSPAGFGRDLFGCSK